MNQFNLKNYTSDVEPEITAVRIEKFLAQAGANHISKHYGGGELVGIDFAIEVMGESLSFRLPVNAEAVFAYMQLNKEQLKKAHISFSMPQARRTAWKLMQDWVESQLSLVATQQAEVAQVFMPYLLSGERTFYYAVKERGFAQLAAPKEE